MANAKKKGIGVAINALHGETVTITITMERRLIESLFFKESKKEVLSKVEESLNFLQTTK